MKKNQALYIFTLIALWALALGIFGSTSLVGVYTVSISVAILLFYIPHFSQIKTLPKSSLLLLTLSAIGVLSFALNFHEYQKPTFMLGKLKYFMIAGLLLPLLKNYILMTTPKALKWLTGAFHFSIILATIFGIVGILMDNNAIAGITFDGSKDRSGGLTDIMRYSYGLALIFPIYLTFFLQSKRKLYLIMCAICVVGVLSSESRGATIGIIIAIPACFYFISKKTFAAITVLLSLCLAGIIYYQSSTQTLKHRFFQDIKSPSNMARVSQFEAAKYAIAEKPILGHGMSSFPVIVERLKKQYDLPYKNFINTHSHNTFLEMATQLGLLGLIVFLGWFALWFKEMKAKRELSYFIPFALVFFAIGQVEQILLTNNMMLVFAIYHLSHLLPNKVQTS